MHTKSQKQQLKMHEIPFGVYNYTLPIHSIMTQEQKSTHTNIKHILSCAEISEKL
jgi:hypothetical protein